MSLLQKIKNSKQNEISKISSNEDVKNIDSNKLSLSERLKLKKLNKESETKNEQLQNPVVLSNEHNLLSSKTILNGYIGQISYKDYKLTINEKTYDLTKISDLTSVSKTMKIKFIESVRSLMREKFEILKEILYGIENNEEKYTFISNIINTICEDLNKKFQKGNIEKDRKDLEIFDNLTFLLNEFTKIYPQGSFNDFLLENYKELLENKNKKFISALKGPVAKAIQNSQRVKEIFYDNIDLSNVNLPTLSSISEIFLNKSSYITDIGEIPYKVEDTIKVQMENVLIKIVSYFQIIKYLLNTNGFVFPKNVKKTDGNLYLNQLFYILAIKKKNGLSIIDILYKLIVDEKEIVNSFIYFFENSDNKTYVVELAKELKKILYVKNEIISIDSLLQNLNAWYKKYQNYFIQNDNLLNQRSGFIAQKTASNNFDNSLVANINGVNEIAEISNGISYANKIYTFLQLCTIIPDYDDSILKKIESGIKSSIKEANVGIDNNGIISYYKVSGQPSDSIRIYTLSEINLITSPVNINLLKNSISALTLPLVEREKEFEFDYWQKDAIQYASDGESFILSGDTSGGKTSLAVVFIELFFKNPKVQILFIVPTDPLAFQVCANLIKTFKKSTIKPVISIYTDTLDIVAENTNILIGTPKDLNGILSIKNTKKFIPTSLETREKTLPDIFDPDFPKIQFDKILIDEIHTMSTSYDVTIEGEKRAVSIQDLLKCSNPQTQIIGFSATLSKTSIQNLKNFVKNSTGIEMKEIIYTFDDIGKKTKNQILTKPVIQKQVKYIITEVDESYDTLPKESKGYKSINRFQEATIKPLFISGRFIFQLLKSIISWGKTPCAVFCGEEHDVLDCYSKLVNFLENGSNSCKLWLDLKYKFESVFFEKISDEVKFSDFWFNLIYEAFIKSISFNDYSEDSLAYVECNLVKDFNIILTRRNIASYKEETLRFISPESYGLMFEIIHFEQFFSSSSFRKPFSGKHPFYRFIVNELKEGMFSPYDSEKKITRFGELLETQKIDFTGSFSSESDNKAKNPLVHLILTGINYGVGIITSTVPFAIQCEIVSYLRKSARSENPLPFIFCDDGMSMGINYSFISTCILLKDLSNISTSSYFQKKGRAGRRSYDILITPDIYLVNVANGNELNEVEDTTYTNNGLSSFFYTPTQLISSVTYYILQTLNENIPISPNSYNELYISEYFPYLQSLGSSQIRLMKLQIKEMFDRLRNVNPLVSENFIKKLFNYIQNVEYQQIQNEF